MVAVTEEESRVLKTLRWLDGEKTPKEQVESTLEMFKLEEVEKKTGCDWDDMSKRQRFEWLWEVRAGEKIHGGDRGD